jgi:hypothetical protein
MPHESCNYEAGERPGDAELRDRLVNGMSSAHKAVLAWLVDGAMKWYADKPAMLKPPARIVRDTEAWRKESDQIFAFIEEQLQFAPACHVRATELLVAFNGWLVTHGHKGWSDKLFASRFGEHDKIKEHHVIKKAVRRRACPSCRKTEGVRVVPLAPPLPPGATCTCGHIWAITPGPGEELSWQGKGAYTPSPVGVPPVYKAWLGLKFAEVGPNSENGVVEQDRVSGVSGAQ